jgi:hypothetical protein
MTREFNPAIDTRRTALSWDREAKPRIDEIRLAFSKAGLELKNRQLFLVCLGLGWQSKSNPGIPPRASDSARMDTLMPEDWAFFNAIAMKATDSFEILSSKDGVLDIVEGYAAGGLRRLVEIYDSTQSLVDALAAEIWPSIESWTVPADD